MILPATAAPEVQRFLIPAPPALPASQPGQAIGAAPGVTSTTESFTSAHTSGGFRKWLSGGVAALGVLAGIGAEESLEAQAAEPIYFDDPRLIQQVIKDRSGAIVSTNWFIPKELDAEGKPVLHSVGYMDRALDPHERQVAGSLGGTAALSIAVPADAHVAIVAAAKGIQIETTRTVPDNTPGAFTSFGFLSATSPEGLGQINPFSSSFVAPDGSAAVVRFAQTDPITRTGTSLSTNHPNASVTWSVEDSGKCL